MADRYLIETSAVDGYLLEDGTGVLLLEAVADNRNVTVVLTGGGVDVSAGMKGATRANVVTGGGVQALVAAKGGLVPLTTLSGGTIGLVASGGHSYAIPLTGGGVLVVVGDGSASGSVPLTAGGVLAIMQASGRMGTVNLTGGGVIIVAGGGTPMALNNLVAIMDGIAAACKTAGIVDRAYAYPAESISVPCVVVGYPDSIDFDVTFMRGADRATFPVYFIVGRVTERAARNTLGAVITGATGIKDTLDGNLSGAVQTARVMDMRVLNVQVNGVDYLAAQFNTEVYV